MSARRSVICVVLSLLLLFPAVSMAEEDEFTSDDYLSGEISPASSETDTAAAGTEFEGSGQAGVDLFWLILKICGVLVLISGGIYGLVHLLKSSGIAGNENSFMKIISSLPVGQDKYLRIVRVGQQFLVIGVTDGSITRLCEIENGETIQALKMAAEKNDEGNAEYSNDFTSVLQRFMGDHSPAGQNNPEGNNPLDEMQEKLQEISTPGETGP